MVREKETFEQWNSKKRSSSVLPGRGLEVPSRVPCPTTTTMRTQVLSGGKPKRKEMKRTVCDPNSLPLNLGGATTLVSPGNFRTEEADTQIDSAICNVKRKEGTKEKAKRFMVGNEESLRGRDRGIGSPGFIKHGGKRNARFPVDSMNEDEEIEELRRSTATSSKQKHTMSTNPEKGREGRMHGGRGECLRRRSRSSSSVSLEEQYVGQKERIELNRKQQGNQVNSSAEEDGGRHCHRKDFRKTELRRHSSKDGKKREGRGERRKKRHRYSSKSSQYVSDDNGRQFEPNMKGGDQSLSSKFHSHDNSFVNRERDCSPRSLVGTDCSSGSENSLHQRRCKDTDGSGNSASEGPVEDQDLVVSEVKFETTLRKERRERQKLRERQVRSREKQGHKAYYLHVNHNGKPYGDGLPAWKLDLNKLARSLDPSVMDVREQPPTDMATLRRRLRQNFDYSHPVDPIYIRQLVGRAITQWRNILWKKMDAGQSRPKEFDFDIWKRLERTRACPSHNEKSERMKHANSCRVTLGRTGPRGEEGVRELLRVQKGVSPDYDDVFTEMQRDKGYGGRAAEKKALQKAKKIASSEGQDIQPFESVPHEGKTKLRKSKCPSTSRASNVKGIQVEEGYISGLLSEIAKLQAVVVAASKGAKASVEGPSTNNREDDKANSVEGGQSFVDDEEDQIREEEGV